MHQASEGESRKQGGQREDSMAQIQVIRLINGHGEEGGGSLV